MIDWDAYRCPLGFLSGKRNPRESSGNAVLFSAHERLLRIRLGDWDEWKQGALVDRVIRHLEIAPGLIRRPPPFSQDTESMDNYVGYASIAPSFSRWAYTQGRDCYYRPFWPMRLPYHYPIDGNAKDARAWMGRYPALIRFFCDRSEGVFQGTLLQDLAWSLSLEFSGNSEDQDPWILNWHLAEANPLHRASRTYWRRLAFHWPGGLARVFAEYLDDEEHPIVLACERLALGKANLA